MNFRNDSPPTSETTRNAALTAADAVVCGRGRQSLMGVSCARVTLPLVSTTVTSWVSGLAGRALCVVVVLGLSFTCVVLAVAASTGATDTTGAADMAGMSMSAGMGEATRAMPLGVAVEDVVAHSGPLMSSMCDTPCVTQASSMCHLAAGLTVTTLLALLLASGRDTFMGMLARKRSPALRRRPRCERTSWTVQSCFSLCVLRV